MVMQELKLLPVPLIHLIQVRERQRLNINTDRSTQSTALIGSYECSLTFELRR